MLWTAICSGALAAASAAVLLGMRDGTLEALVGAVLVAALTVLARAAVPLASGPADARSVDERP